MSNNEEPKSEIVTAAKLISAAILVFAGAVLIVGGAYEKHGDTQRFLYLVGSAVGLAGLVCWFISLSKSNGGDK